MAEQKTIETFVDRTEEGTLEFDAHLSLIWVDPERPSIGEESTFLSAVIVLVESGLLDDNGHPTNRIFKVLELHFIDIDQLVPIGLLVVERLEKKRDLQSVLTIALILYLCQVTQHRFQ